MDRVTSQTKVIGVELVEQALDAACKLGTVRCPRTAKVILVVLSLACGCEDSTEIEPDFEWHGQRIDIVGFDTHPEDTCAGTFTYLDDFADSIGNQFGVFGHLGTYRWYSPARFASASPCPENSGGCAGSNGAFAPRIPLEHEVVHMVHGRCPSVIAEGLAEYYGVDGVPSATGDIAELIAQSELGNIAFDSYSVAGAFAAYLVESYGLDSVQRLCEISGPYPSPDLFAEAASTAFDVPFDQILLEFNDYDCVYSEYRSKVFECDGEPDLTIGAEAAELKLRLDCQSPTTVGPRNEEIWTLARLRVLSEEVYLAEAFSAAGASEGVRVELTDCGGCYDSPRTQRLTVDGPPDPIQLKARDYIVRVAGPPEFTDDVNLRLTAL